MGEQIVAGYARIELGLEHLRIHGYTVTASKRLN